MLSTLSQPLSSSLLLATSEYAHRASSAMNNASSEFSWATASEEGSRGPGSWGDAESAPSTPRMYNGTDTLAGLTSSFGAAPHTSLPMSPGASWEPSSPASSSSSLDGTAPPACGLAAVFAAQRKQIHDIKWKASPPAQLELALGTEYLQRMLSHLPLDSRHWRQLEQLLENRDIGILQCIVNNYLQYEHPAKWEARKDCQVVNVAGYLNRNIRQKVQMLRNRPELVTLVLQLQVQHPEIAQHLDGRMLQYLHDHLDADDISRFGDFAVGALGQDWSVGVVSPRVVLHFVVKSYIQSVKERQCCWQKADEIIHSLHDRLQQQPQMLHHHSLYQMGMPLGCC